MLGFLLEECVTGLAEAFEYLGIHILGREAYRFPLCLDGNYLFCYLVPVGKRFKFVEFKAFYLFAKRSLLYEVLFFAGLDFLIIFLVTFVYLRRSRFETLPNRFAQILCHRPYFPKFLMKFLKLVESGNGIRLFKQFFCGFANMYLCLIVFLEVVLAELAVKFQQVVELLHIKLITLPKIRSILCRHWVCFTPFSLELAELFVILVGFFGRG